MTENEYVQIHLEIQNIVDFIIGERKETVQNVIALNMCPVGSGHRLVRVTVQQ